MGSLAILQSLKESVLGHADVKAIYGQPITAHEKTIVPVAKIMFAYGAGAGTGGMGNDNPRGEGGGGGGGVRAVPVGVFEVGPQGTRFVSVTDRRKIAGVLVAGMAVGMWLGWKRDR
jgi:uncharacterized spore protein YtfJ